MSSHRAFLVTIRNHIPYYYITVGIVAALIIGYLTVMGTTLRSAYFWQGMDLPRALSYSADKPFVYRLLVPHVVNLIAESVPHSGQMWLLSKFHFSSRHESPYFISDYLRTPEYEFQGLLIILIGAVSLATYLAILFMIGRKLYPKDINAALLFPLAGVFALEPFVMPRYYYYDFPTLAIWAGCYYAVYCKSLRAYFACFVLACLNKETAALLIPYFLICSRYLELRAKKLAILIGAQLLMCALNFSFLSYHFSYSTKSALQDHLRENIVTQMFAGYNLETYTMFFGLIFILRLGWQYKPFVFKAPLALFPFFYVLYRWGGCCIEWRVFYELFPAFVTLAVISLIDLRLYTRGNPAIPASDS